MTAMRKIMKKYRLTDFGCQVIQVMARFNYVCIWGSSSEAQVNKNEKKKNKSLSKREKRSND